jgi:hypothetical protein
LVQPRLNAKKRVLHILKTKPDEIQNHLISDLCKGRKCVQIPLFEENVDYEALVDLIFECEEVVTWW